MAKLRRTRRSKAVARAHRMVRENTFYVKRRLTGTMHLNDDGTVSFVCPPWKGTRLYTIEYSSKRYGYRPPEYLLKYF